LTKDEGKTRPSKLPKKVQIKRAARYLITQRGIGGVSYGDIAKQAETTPANVHYHFGNKETLVNAVFQENFEAVEIVLRDIWLEPGPTLDERIMLLANYFQERFYEFNDDERGRRPWSMVARAQFEEYLLSPEIQHGIAEMSRRFEQYLAHAIKLAIGNGELRGNAPINDIVLLLTPLWYFSSLLTQHSGLKKMMRHYAAVRKTLQAAYGTTSPEKREEDLGNGPDLDTLA